MLTLRQIELFHAVMVTTTISGAARLLGASQPGLSRMLRHMEDRIGFRLFDRTRGRLVPTHEAHVLFEEIAHLHKQIQDIGQVAEQLAKGGERLFRVGASPSLGHSVVPEMLSRLLTNYPTLNLRFDVLSVEQVADYLTLRRGEYALTVFPVDHPNILSSRVSMARMVCAVPAGHPLSERTQVAIGDLAEERVISFPPETPHGAIIADIAARSGADLRIGMHVRFAETAVAFVRAGMGVALVDSFTAMGTMSHEVRFVELADPGQLPVYLNRNLEAPRAMIGETFEEIVRTVLRSVPRAPGAGGL